MYSFITYTLISRNGIIKNDQPCFDVAEDEIERLYPAYSPDALPESIRRWIETGVWEENALSREIAGPCGEDTPDHTEKE